MSIGVVADHYVGRLPYLSEILLDSPRAAWRQGEAVGPTMLDSSGNARNGTYTTAPTLGVAGLLAGDANTAANYNGTSHHASVVNAAWMDVGTVTAEAWVKTDAIGAVQMIVARDMGTFTGSSMRSWQLRISAAGKPQFVIWAVDGGAAQTCSGLTTLSASTNYYLAGTYDGITNRVFLNGVQDGSLAAAGSIPIGNGGPIVVAKDPSSSAFFFDGVIDEVAMYSGALSPARIAAHYAAGI